MGPRKQKAAKEEQITLGPQLAEGENNFGVAHIFASFNDTFVHVTDLSGRYSIFRPPMLCIGGFFRNGGQMAKWCKIDL